MKAYILSAITNTPVTAFIFLGVIFFGVISMLSPKFQIKFMLHPYSILRNHEYYRLFTADFVHNNLYHLFINIFLIYAIATKLEIYLKQRITSGSVVFLFIYFFSMLFGNLCVSLLNNKDFNYSSAGASGSLTGCMMSYMIFQPNVEGIYLPIIGGIRNIIAVLLFIIGFILYQFKNPDSSVNNELHFFSGVGGVVITMIILLGDLI